MFLEDISINLTGVLWAAIAYFIIGMIWYHPIAFGSYLKEPSINHQNHHLYKIIPYIGEFILSFIIAYTLSLMIQINQANEMIEGLIFTFWIWLGFIATTHFSSVLWDRKTLKHFFIHIGFMLIGFLMMGMIILYFDFS